MPIKPQKLELPILAELICRGDGSYVIRPKQLPSGDLDTWIDVKQTAKVLGSTIRPQGIYALLGEFLVYRRPLKKRVEVSLRSAVALRDAANDPDFWDNPISQQAIKKTVEQAMRKLLESALQPG